MTEPSFQPFRELEPQELETKNFSGLALLGFLGSLLSCFSILYVHFVPIAVASVVAGSIALIIAKRSQLSTFSQVLAAAAVSIASTTASWGYFSRSKTLDYDLDAAKNVAQQYLENLSAGNREKILMLAGLQLEVGDMSPDSSPKKQESPLVIVTRRLESDPPHIEILNRKKPAKWEFVSFDGEHNTEGSGHTYKLRFVDKGQTHPPSYWVLARKDCPKAGPHLSTRNAGVPAEEHDLTIHWYVDSIQTPQ